MLSPHDISQLTGIDISEIGDVCGRFFVTGDAPQETLERLAAVIQREGLAVEPQRFLSQWRAVDPAAVPTTVTARQIRLWLVSRGVGMAAVEAAIDGIPDATQREMVRVEWEYAPYVERTHPMLAPLAAALGLTEAQVDQGFREAASL